MPRLKIAGNTRKKKKCNPTKSFPCGYSCQSIGRNCRKILKGQGKNSQEWLRLQGERLERVGGYLKKRKERVKSVEPWEMTATEYDKMARDRWARSVSYGDLVKTKDGFIGVVRGAGGMGSERIKVVSPTNEYSSSYANRSEVTIIRKDGKYYDDQMAADNADKWLKEVHDEVLRLKTENKVLLERKSLRDSFRSKHKQGLATKEQLDKLLAEYPQSAKDEQRAEQVLKEIEATRNRAIPPTKTMHEQLVERALKQGKVVPDRVLKDYPHLTQKPAETSKITEGYPQKQKGQNTGAEPTTGRQPDLDGRIDGTSDRRISAKSQQEKIVTARPELTRPSDPTVVPQELRQFLSDAQIHGVSVAVKGMEEHGGFLIADGTGLGKTREILSIADIYAKQGKKVLIVSPNEVLKPDYKKGTVVGSFADDSRTLGVNITLTKGAEPLQKGAIAVATYQNLKDLKGQVDGDTVLLLDEAHNFKNYDSAKTKHGLEMLRTADKVLYATATPVDKPEHLHYLSRAGVFKGNKPEAIYSWLGLRQKEIRVGGGKTVKKWVIPKGESPAVYERMTGLFDDMTESGKMIKREISMKGVDVGFKTITLPDSAYSMLDDVAQAYDLGEGSGLQKAQMLMQQRRQLEPYKIPSAIESAKEAIARGDQVVIFASRVNESDVLKDEKTGKSVASSEGTIKTLVQALKDEGIPVTELHGGTKIKAADAMADFQSGKARVIVATIESGGTGINLDDNVGDKPRTLIMMTPPFSAVENVQAAGRVWRMSSQSYPKIEYLMTDADVDAWNREIIAAKMKSLGAATKGESGVLAPDSIDDYNDLATTGKTAAPRPPSPTASTRKMPPGFFANKFDGWTPDGIHVKAGEGYIRQENGRWITYSADSVDERGRVTLKPVDPEQKARLAKKREYIPNRYDGVSPSGKRVPAGEGYVRKEGGRWVTYHKSEVDFSEQIYRSFASIKPARLKTPC